MPKDSKSFITAFCNKCQAPRYRSTVPLGLTDTAAPELFKAVDAEAPAPASGPAVCFVCKQVLVFRPDEKLVVEPETFQAHDDTEPVMPSSPVDILFELRPDEEMKVFEDLPSGYLVVTTKRILKIKKG